MDFEHPIIVTIVGGLILAGILGFIRWGKDRVKKDKGNEKAESSTYNVISHDQKGGITAANVTVNSQPGWRDIRDRPADVQNIADIVAAHPGRTFKLSVVFGNNEAKNYARQIQAMLRNNDVEVEDFISDAMYSNPMPPLSYDYEGGKVVLQIGDQNSPVRPTGKSPS